MQGGHHPKLTMQWDLDLLSHIKSKFPQVNIHGFSPSEFIHFARVFNLPLEELFPGLSRPGWARFHGRWRRDSGGSRAPADFSA